MLLTLGGLIIIRMRVLEFTPDVPLEAGGGDAAGQRVRVTFSWQMNARRILALHKAGVA